jgi:AAA+ superfamily predicted ATPase
VKIDGFEQDRRVVVIAATNRKEELDPALIRCSFLLMCLFFYCKQSQIVLAVLVLLQKLP